MDVFGRIDERYHMRIHQENSETELYGGRLRLADKFCKHFCFFLRACRI